jgi:hypothetical protein
VGWGGVGWVKGDVHWCPITTVSYYLMIAELII